jgi:chromosome partitioning protein
MKTSHRFMQLIPASKQLSGFERLFFRTQDSKKRLSERLDGLEGGYDFIAIDTAPTLSFLNVSALIASKEVYIPFQAHFLSLEGLAEMISLVGKVRKIYGVDLRVKGVIPTFFNPRTRLSREILAEIRENLGERVLLCPVRQNIALAEAPSRGQTVFQYDPQSNGAVDYLRIAYQIEQLA